MKFFFPTMPRSGSEFVIKLCRLLLESGSNSILSLTPGRMVNLKDGNSKIFQEKIKENKEIEYIREQRSKCIKVESPSADILCYDLSTFFPESKWITSFRTIDEIIISHYNLKTWGWSERKILNAYICDLAFYEFLAEQGRMFFININKPELFNLKKITDFLGVSSEISEQTKDFIQNWYVVNPLERQQKKAMEEVRLKEIPANLSTLRTRHPWLIEIEERYECLLIKCS